MMKKGSLTSTILGLMLTLILLSSGLATFAIVNLTYSLGDARAINASGSLRMQSYRLMFYTHTNKTETTQKIQEFEETLYSDVLMSPLDWITPPALEAQYHLVVQKWQVMRTYIEQRNSFHYAAALKDFVDTIDLLVLEIEHHAAFKLKLLAASQILGLAFMLFITLMAVRFTKKNVVIPLQQMMRSANQISKGNFSINMPKTEYIELTALSDALESTASELSTLYQGLENQVKEKTHALTRSNNELKLLYDNLVMLHSDKLEINSLKMALNQLRAHEPDSFLRIVIAKNDGEEELVIEADGGWPTESGNQTHFPLIFKANELGYLEVNSSVEPNHLLFTNFAIMIARSIVIFSASEQRQQYALMEERSVIARELHDSLGQILSFLKIQVSLLSKELNKTDKNAQVELQLSEINQGVNSAYVELRELLSTFRLTIKEPNLNNAIEAMLSQLRSQSDVNITLDYKLPLQLLGAHQHIHVLQLTREATLNAIKHAQAKNIAIRCFKNSETHVCITISDDGIGVEQLKEKEQHFGIGIMHERASRLSGIVSFSSNPGGGTKITLTFPPQQEPVNNTKTQPD